MCVMDMGNVYFMYNTHNSSINGYFKEWRRMGFCWMPCPLHPGEQNVLDGKTRETRLRRTSSQPILDEPCLCFFLTFFLSLFSDNNNVTLGCYTII